MSESELFDLSGFPDLLKPKDVLRILRCGRRQVYALIQKGQLRYVRLGEKGIRVPRAALLEFLRKRTVG